MKDQITPSSTQSAAKGFGTAPAANGEPNTVQNLSSDAGLGRTSARPVQDADSTRKAIGVLNELIETSRDGEKGFALAAKDSQDASLSTLFSEGEKSCREAVAELQDLVRSLGGNAEEDGSMKAAVHRGWVSIKSAATSRDSKAILEECERGEDYAKAKYSEALKQDLPPQVRSVIERQYEGVVQNHDRVRDLRNQYRA